MLTRTHLFRCSIQDSRQSINDLLEWIDNCLPGLRRSSTHLTFQAFFCLLASDENTIFDPYRLKVYQDMKLPLSNYFISSSDTSFWNPSTPPEITTRIQRDLISGYRAIELHCWDGFGEDEGSPVVAYPLCCSDDDNDNFNSYPFIQNKFSDVVEIINTYGFVQSSFPLILLLEIHCSISAQEKIADCLLSSLGDMLVPQNEMIYKLPRDRFSLPSPHDLQNKIVLILSQHKENYAIHLPDKLLKERSRWNLCSQQTESKVDTNTGSDLEEIILGMGEGLDSPLRDKVAIERDLDNIIAGSF